MPNTASAPRSRLAWKYLVIRTPKPLYSLQLNNLAPANLAANDRGPAFALRPVASRTGIRGRQKGPEGKMTTRITQIEDQEKKRTTIRVEGSLHGEDAEVLENTLMNLQHEQMHEVAIDLTNISFLDSESASVLCRLKKLGVELVGLHFFVQQILELAQSSETN